MEIRLQPLTADKLPEFRALLGSSDFGGCFCAVWTSHGADWEQRCGDSSQPNFAITAKNVEEEKHTGFLVYSGDQLVGWTGSGPRTAFPLLESKLGSRLSPHTDSVWSIGCLAVSEKFRGQKLGEKIVQAVIEKARASGAEALEAYPVRPFHEPRAYRGTVSLFSRMGFAEKGAEKDGAHDILLMRFSL
ncbi:MAG: GNAT family N-acetyltransferase [Bdellovibrionota bacterium]